jgi:hypothetical protein
VPRLGQPLNFIATSPPTFNIFPGKTKHKVIQAYTDIQERDLKSIFHPAAQIHP